MNLVRKNQMFLPLAIFSAALVLFTSCRKDPEAVAELLSNTDAAEIAETAIAERTAGAAMPTIDMAQIVDAYLNSCGVPGDTSIQKSKTAPAASYNYNFNMNWLVNRSALGVPQDATFSVTGNGTFSTPHWTGNDATTGNLTFSGLSLQETAYIVNGTYTLQGDITGSLRKLDPSFNCVSEISLSNMTIDKTTYKVTGGGGSVTITGTTANGTSKTLEGTLVFNGNETVTVVVNGYAHTFNL